MDNFIELVRIIDRLLGPGGCPWDQEQTLKSLRSAALEEAFELSEAIDLDNDEHILEEVGDLFFIAVFFCRLAEKEGRFNKDQVLKNINDKLIRRHPHVFGQGKVGSSEEVIGQWDRIKQTEKGKEHRKSVLDGLPKGLPALTRAQKSIKKMIKAKFSVPQKLGVLFDDEESLGEGLIATIAKAHSKDIDVEHALRKALHKLEEDFRKQEMS